MTMFRGSVQRFLAIAHSSVAHLILCFCFAVVLCLPTTILQASEISNLQQLSGTLKDNSKVASYALLVRHALAPGTGDPQEVVIDDCSTQRNLNDEGREQSARIGRLLQQAGLPDLEIFTSQWCRCRETAEIARGSLMRASGSASADKLPQVEDLPALNSFFSQYEERESQTVEVKQWLDDRAQSGTERLALLVSHQVNITALSGAYPSSGEIVVVEFRDGEVNVIASVPTL